MEEGKAAETRALKCEVFRNCSVAAAITLEPDPAAANSHRLSLIVLYAIRTANGIGIRHRKKVKKPQLIGPLPESGLFCMLAVYYSYLNATKGSSFAARRPGI